MLLDISTKKPLMVFLFILSFLLEPLIIEEFFTFGVGLKFYYLFIFGSLGIISLIILLINPFKTYKKLNIINMFISLASLNLPALIISLIKTTFYENIHDREEYIDEYAIELDNNSIKKIKASTITSIVLMVIYLPTIILFGPFWDFIYALLSLKGVFVTSPSDVGAIFFIAYLYYTFILLCFIILFSIPIIIWYLNILFSYKALKYRERRYFKILQILGIISLTFTNMIAASRILRENKINKERVLES